MNKEIKYTQHFLQRAKNRFPQMGRQELEDDMRQSVNEGRYNMQVNGRKATYIISSDGTAITALKKHMRVAVDVRCEKCLKEHKK